MSLITKIEFGNVKSDSEFVAKASELNSALVKIHKHLNLIEESGVNMNKMSEEEKINFKLFQVYAINSLCWIQLRLRGSDPNDHAVKQQLLRLRKLMQKRDEIVDKKLRPTLDKGAAKRFIRSGLWDPRAVDQGGPVNKKIKFKDDE